MFLGSRSSSPDLATPLTDIMPQNPWATPEGDDLTPKPGARSILALFRCRCLNLYHRRFRINGFVGLSGIVRFFQATFGNEFHGVNAL